MSNRWYDLLHIGHVFSLKFAKNLGDIGDILVVAVNDDHSVRKIIGELRPVIPIQMIICWDSIEHDTKKFVKRKKNENY